jgi:hypothetical protein
MASAVARKAESIFVLGGGAVGLFLTSHLAAAGNGRGASSFSLNAQQQGILNNNGGCSEVKLLLRSPPSSLSHHIGSDGNIAGGEVRIRRYAAGRSVNSVFTEEEEEFLDVVVPYELASSSPYNQLLGDREGEEEEVIKHLLLCTKAFDASSALLSVAQ